MHASNAARFEQSFRDIANYVQVPGRQDKDANIFQLVHDWLRDESRKWVLILDNVDDADFLLDSRDSLVSQTTGANSNVEQPLASHLPQCTNGSILLTTRSMDTARKLVEDRGIIVVQPMTKDEAVKLMQKKLQSEENVNTLDDLVTALENMPLAIVQAAAYIVQRGPRCSIQQYLDQFRESDRQKESLLDREGGQLRRDREANNSIMTTWQISFEYIRQVRSSATDLLSFMSFFDRQGIPEVLLRNRTRNMAAEPESLTNNAHPELEPNHFFFNSFRRLKAKAYKKLKNRKANQSRLYDIRGEDNYENNDEESTSQTNIDDVSEDDITFLRSYSFISVSRDGNTFEMHRLVQLATRKWLTENNQLEHWERQFLQNMDAELPNGEYENWERCQLFFPHVTLTATRKPKNQELWRNWASILYKGAWYAGRMGDGVQTEILALQSMKARKKVLGEDHTDTLRSMDLVGRGRRLQGRWSAAEELFVQVMETSKKKLGQDHPSTLTSMYVCMYVLFNVYGNAGQRPPLRPPMGYGTRCAIYVCSRDRFYPQGRGVYSVTGSLQSVPP